MLRENYPGCVEFFSRTKTNYLTKNVSVLDDIFYWPPTVAAFFTYSKKCNFFLSTRMFDLIYYLSVREDFNVRV